MDLSVPVSIPAFFVRILCCFLAMGSSLGLFFTFKFRKNIIPQKHGRVTIKNADYDF